MSNINECLNVLPWGNRINNNLVLWNNLIFAQYENSCYVTQWNKRHMTIFQVDKREVRDVRISTLRCATQLCQDLNFPETVVQVFEWSGTVYFLTQSGVLKALKFNESTIRYLKKGTGTGCFKTILSVLPPKKVLQACPVNKNLLLLATVLNGYIAVEIYNVAEDMDLLDSVPLEKQEPQDGMASVIMCRCNSNITSQLTRVESNQYSVVLVGLNTGSVYWLPFMKDTLVVPEARKLYQAGRKVEDITCLEGDNSNVFVLLEGGVIISIASSKVKSQQVGRSSTSLQFDTIALPGSIRALCLSAKFNSILCSDGIQCWLVKDATDKTETILLPLKGVTGFLALPESDICLATTKHNTCYAVNVASDFSALVARDERIIQKCCDLETPCQYISELKEKTNDLLEIEAALKLEDSVLAGISAAARGKILRDNFSGRVVVHNVDTRDPADEHAHWNPPIDTKTLYKLSVEIKNNSNIEFPANLWKMSVSVVTRDRGVLSKTVSLPDSLAHSVQFFSHLYVQLQSVDLVADPKVKVSLIAELPDRGRWISVPVLEENLHLSYFITVIFDTDKGFSRSPAVSVHNRINELVGQNSNNQQRSSVIYSMSVPQQLRDVADFMECLLSKCRHRCEGFLKQIKGGTEQREFKLLFGDAAVIVSFNRTVSLLTITGSNAEMVHAVKTWIIRLLAESYGGDLASSDVVSKAKWLRSVLEKESAKACMDVMDVMDVGQLKEIHTELRNNVSSALPI